jgi:hypothetical protein
MRKWEPPTGLFLRRGVWTLTERRLREELWKFDDFSCDGVPLVDEMVVGRGHMCQFLPRFHCELNHLQEVCSKSIVKWFKENVFTDHYSTLIPNLSTARDELYDRLEDNANHLLAPARVATRKLKKPRKPIETTHNPLNPPKIKVSQ